MLISNSFRPFGLSVFLYVILTTQWVSLRCLSPQHIVLNLRWCAAKVARCSGSLPEHGQSKPKRPTKPNKGLLPMVLDHNEACGSKGQECTG